MFVGGKICDVFKSGGQGQKVRIGDEGAEERRQQIKNV